MNRLAAWLVFFAFLYFVTASTTCAMHSDRMKLERCKGVHGDCW